MTPDIQGKGNREETDCNQEADESAPGSLPRASKANHQDVGEKEHYAENLARYWECILKHLPSAQATTNWLIAAFTGLLAFIAIVTEQPRVVVQPSPLQNFQKGGTPSEWITFDNIGHQPAKSFVTCGLIETLNSPLGNTHLTECKPNSIPVDLFPTSPISTPLAYNKPIGDADYDAVHEGKGKQVYVWGTIKYKDFFHLSHTGNFCFAFDAEHITTPSLCVVERPRISYGLEND